MGIADAFPAIYVLSGLWQSIGWSSILYISALSSISMEEIEAARIDGCSEVGIFTKIVMPLSKPVFMSVSIFISSKIIWIPDLRVAFVKDKNAKPSPPAAPAPA